ncbi:MAG: GntR family transcriptional regulator [Hyphomonadaceae bacterium]|nr:GntR family transcriptional regulator [Hyphomonadaceae bacterium]
MALEASAAQRAYAEIKARILNGDLPVRTRLDMEQLARTLGVSSMPVRLALSLLSWERLVRPSRHAAYEVALWSAEELAQLYEWRGELLLLAQARTSASAELKRLARTQPYAQAVEQAMRLIEEGANPDLRRAALNADERLHLARLSEAEVLGDVEGEFENMAAAIAEKSRRAGVLIKAYHRRRAQHAATLRDRVALKALPNNGSR